MKSVCLIGFIISAGKRMVEKEPIAGVGGSSVHDHHHHGSANASAAAAGPNWRTTS